MTEIEKLDQEIAELHKRRERLEYADYHRILRETLAPMMHACLTSMEDDAAFAERFAAMAREKSRVESESHPIYSRAGQRGLQGMQQGMNQQQLGLQYANAALNMARMPYGQR